jgi:hypothetical protein
MTKHCSLAPAPAGRKNGKCVDASSFGWWGFTVAPGREGGGYVGFDQYDVVTQQFTSNHVTVSADGQGRFRRIPFRYAWPAEMDLMARIAGLSLKYRWAGWDRSAFTAESTTHVSVWQKP